MIACRKTEGHPFADFVCLQTGVLHRPVGQERGGDVVLARTDDVEVPVLSRRKVKLEGLGRSERSAWYSLRRWPIPGPGNLQPVTHRLDRRHRRMILSSGI